MATRQKPSRVQELEAQMRAALTGLAAEGYAVNWLKLWEQSGHPFPTPSGDFGTRLNVLTDVIAAEGAAKVDLKAAARLMSEIAQAEDLFEAEKSLLHKLWDFVRTNVLPPAMEAQGNANGFKDDVVGSVIIIPELFVSIRANNDGKKNDPRYVVEVEAPKIPGVEAKDPVAYVEAPEPGFYRVRWAVTHWDIESIAAPKGKTPKGIYQAVEVKMAAFQWLRDRGFEDLISETVNGNSLKSTIKGVIDSKAHDVPSTLFKLTPTKYAKINQPKEKSKDK